MRFSIRFYLFSSALITVFLLASGCGPPSKTRMPAFRRVSLYELISPDKVMPVRQGCGEKLVKFMSSGKGIVREFNIEGWRLKFSSTQAPPSLGALIEDRGPLSGLVVSGNVSMVLQGKVKYALIFSSDCHFELPLEDKTDDGSFILHNDDYLVREYLVREYTEKMISSGIGVIPPLSVTYFERIKQSH